jgi:hypothetical protein
MNPAFDQIIAAEDEERAGLFAATAQRLGTTPQNAEKDFWVCWVLDALFNGRPDSAPRLLFKDGTSLSKGFGLIRRFSERYRRDGVSRRYRRTGLGGEPASDERQET